MDEHHHRQSHRLRSSIPEVKIKVDKVVIVGRDSHPAMEDTGIKMITGMVEGATDITAGMDRGSKAVEQITTEDKVSSRLLEATMAEDERGAIHAEAL